MRISDWSSDVCSSDLPERHTPEVRCMERGLPTIRRRMNAPDASIAAKTIGARRAIVPTIFAESSRKLLIVSGRQAPRQGEQEGMQMNYRFHAGIAALATCLAGSPVQAQESSQTQMSFDLDGDIIVTARRQAERLQDVPISIIDRKSTRLNSSH